MKGWHLTSDGCLFPSSLLGIPFSMPSVSSFDSLSSHCLCPEHTQYTFNVFLKKHLLTEVYELRVWHPKPSLPISSKFWQSCSWCKVNFLTAGSSCLPVVMTSFFSFLFTLLIQLLMSLAFESSSLDDIYFAWDSVAHTFLPNFLASSSELLDVKA